jgi:MATE family multidrug resistance protein
VLVTLDPTLAAMAKLATAMSEPLPPPVTHRRVLSIALPIMLTNVSQPLLGIVDTAVIGRLPDPHYIGAIAIGALIFSFL